VLLLVFVDVEVDAALLVAVVFILVVVSCPKTGKAMRNMAVHIQRFISHSPSVFKLLAVCFTLIPNKMRY